MTSISIQKYPLDNQSKLFNELLNKKKYINNSWLLIPEKFFNLILYFIEYKKIYGSIVEKIYYKNANIDSMLDKLFKKRPLVFVGMADSYILRNGDMGIGHWENIGTDNEQFPLVLTDYNSYDEIELASFLSISIHTPFINNGSRGNAGRQDPTISYQKEGIYVGQVGARFQKKNRMEWRYMVIDKEQNTTENGYGIDNNSLKGLFLKGWADFYEIPYFPTFDEIMLHKDDIFSSNGFENEIINYNAKYIQLSTISYLNVEVYKKRVKYNANVFLNDANNRAKNEQTTAFCHAVGLGLGVWKVSELQGMISVSVYLEIIKENKFEYISDIYFSWFHVENDKDFKNIPTEINGIKLHFGKREPAELLKGEDTNKLLVCNWAWDPNSYIGNEYWDGRLSTSGDPAAACCSFVAYFGNPDVCKIKNVHFY